MFSKIKCPKCGVKNDPEDKKCFYCGEKLIVKNITNKKKERLSVPPIYAVMITINMILLLVAIALSVYSIYMTPASIKNYVDSHKSELKGDRGEMGPQGFAGKNGTNGTSSTSSAKRCTTSQGLVPGSVDTICY